MQQNICQNICQIWKWYPCIFSFILSYISFEYSQFCGVSVRGCFLVNRYAPRTPIWRSSTPGSPSAFDFGEKAWDDRCSVSKEYKNHSCTHCCTPRVILYHVRSTHPSRFLKITVQQYRHLTFIRVLYGYPSVHGAVFWNRKSYGPVRCGFKKAEILRCGSVRVSDIVNTTARCGAVIYPRVRFGAVFRIRECYGAVRCGFQMSWNLRCGSVIFYVLRCGSVRFGFEEGKNPTVNRTEPIGKTAPNR